MLDPIYCTTILAILYCLILYFIRPALVSPITLVTPVLAFYSLGSLQLAESTGFRTIGTAETVSTAALYSSLCIAAFLVGSINGFLWRGGVVKLSVTGSRSSIGFATGYFLLSFLFGNIFAYLAAGSIVTLSQNLHLRQSLSVGNTWPMFFVECIPMAYAICYARVVAETRRTTLFAQALLGVAALVSVVWLSFIGGRLFAVQFLIQVLLLRSFLDLGAGRSLIVPAMVAGSVIVVVIFVYGFFRVGQGQVGGGGLSFLVSMITDYSTVSDVVSYFLVNNFFDGWYVLLAAIESTEKCQCYSYGIQTLGSIFKIVPGLTSSIVDPYIMTVGNSIYTPGQVGERTLSLFAIEYTEFGLFGFFFFFLLGLGLEIVWKNVYGWAVSRETNRGGRVYIGFFYGAVIVNVLALIRSGPAVAFTWLFASLFWLFVYWTFASKRLRLRRLAGSAGWLARRPHSR